MSAPRFREPAPGHRDWYAFEAIRAIPRLVLLVDKNQSSRTYGCFDREFWHYRTVDFPCGMSQEMGLPLALAHKHELGGQNPYWKNPRLAELAIAAIEFARSITHPDGSTDDYFPYERALGAHVFSTYALSETYQALELARPDLIQFFRRRGDWLLANNESGQLANHQAFAALALWNLYDLTGDTKYRDGSNAFRDLTLSWQHDEGWFQEYEGADPGYHSCSIAFFGKLLRKCGPGSETEAKLIEPLKKAVEFASYFMHPDGSYAGEYGSRNTYHFYPHGFEVMAPHTRTGARIAQTFLERGMPDRRRYYNDDNRMAAHYVYDWIHAWLDWSAERDGGLEEHRAPFERWFSDARILVKKTPRYYAVLSLAKGGVLKVYDERGCFYSDTGLVAETTDGNVLVSHLVDDHQLQVGESRYGASGFLSRRRHQLSSPLKQIGFRTMNLSAGRFAPNLVRSTLQKVLITGKPRTGVRFAREFVFGDDAITIHDRVDLSGEPRVSLKRLSAASDATSIYVANSNTFQESVLLPWTDLSSHVDDLNRRRTVDLPPRRIARAG